VRLQTHPARVAAADMGTYNMPFLLSLRKTDSATDLTKSNQSNLASRLSRTVGRAG